MAQAIQTSFVPPKGIECADLTARKVHQYAVVGVAALALLVGGAPGVALLALDGVVMALGRFWGPADIFRQLVWRIAEPRGRLTPRLVPEDLGTRRVARVLGGFGFFASAAAVYAQNLSLALAIALPLCAMILFDATVNFCALCFLNFQARRVRYLLSQ